MKAYFVALVILLSAGDAFAANHYIRAGAMGAGDGSSWANAWPTFAAVTWTRGDTYYVAGGTYSANVGITTGESGSLWITVKKANAADNERDPGWHAAYASTQAVILGRLAVDYGYFEMDGVTGSGESGHGIKIYTATQPDVKAVIYMSSGTASPRRFHHLEVKGPGWPQSLNGIADGIYWNSSVAGSKGLHISDCWIHDATRNGITTGNTVGTSYSDYGMLFENNVVSETGSDVPANHGQGMQLSYARSNAYTIIRNNIFRNINGTGNIVYMGGASAHSQSLVYNNVFYYTDLATYGVSSPGVICILSGTNTADSIFIYNNTFYGVGSAAVTTAKAQIWNSIPTATNIEVKNNVWVNSNFTYKHYGVGSVSNNDYYQNTGAGVPTGETNQVTESADPFVNSAAYDFRLKSTANAKVHGVDLSSVFSTDILGTPRGVYGRWTIGAYEGIGLAAPTNVRIIR